MRGKRPVVPGPPDPESFDRKVTPRSMRWGEKASEAPSETLFFSLAAQPG